MLASSVRSLVLCIACALGGCDFRGIRPTFDIAGPVPPISDASGEFAAALFQTTGTRLLPGHTWTLESNGTVFDTLVEDIAAARVSINFLLYIWEPGEASDRLLQALGSRAPGVRCRVLVDPFGSPDFQKEVMPQLIAMGCEARLFRPVVRANLFERNHRKIVVFDGRVSYLGGFGVRTEWHSKRRRFYRRSRFRFPYEWRDDNIRVVGPVVNDVQRAFAQNWQEAGGSLLPANELPTIEPAGDARVAFVSSTAAYLTDTERLVHLLVRAAQKRVYIANAYFVPDASLVKLLIDKAKAGVDVRVLAPGSLNNDITIAAIAQRRLYGQLLRGGIKVFEYQPVMMHEKTMLIDDRWAMVGSLNLNLLSLTRLEEAVFLIEDPALVKALDDNWQGDMHDSRLVKSKD